MNNLHPKYLLSITTLFGVVSGGLFWLYVYDSRHTSIGFDGPAGVLLTISVISGCIIFGFPTTLYLIIKKHLSFIKLVLFFIFVSIVASTVVVYFIAKFAMVKYSDAPKEYTTLELMKPLA